MRKIIVHAGFHPETPREYHGEHIYKVVHTRDGGAAHDFHSGALLAAAGRYYGLDNGAWIKDLGGERYQTDWTGEERWGRVEAVETDEDGTVRSAETLGFMLLRVDRAHGLL